MNHEVLLRYYYWRENIVNHELEHLLHEAIDAASIAGDVLLSFFKLLESHQINEKSDQSPVTQADIAANAVIVDRLQKYDPSLPILSEENELPDFSIRQQWQRYWLVDPLDGTRGFIRQSPEFCVNIALIENHLPIIGVIYSPVGRRCFYAIKNQGAFLIDAGNHKPVALLASKYILNQLRFICGNFDRSIQFHEMLKTHFQHLSLTKMNSALKFSCLAQGLADLYARLGPTSEWDTAAGQCILEEAGGSVVDFQGQSLQYNTKSSIINPPFLAMGDPIVFKYIKEITPWKKQLK